MKIQDALKPTGKASPKGCMWYIEKVPESDYQYRCIYQDGDELHDEGKTIDIHHMLRDDWQPYHDKKEIRPEKAGELWRHTCSGLHLHTDEGPAQQLCLVGWNGPEREAINNAVHGSGWTRIHPHVEDENIPSKECCDSQDELYKDENVERIEIENVICKEEGACVFTIPETTFTTYLEDFANKPITMILEIPKEPK